QLLDDGGGGAQRALPPVHGDAVTVEPEQARRLVNKTVVTTIPAALDDVCLLPPCWLALQIGGRATDQANVASAGLAQIFEQRVDGGWNLRHRLLPPRHLRILGNATVAIDDLADRAALWLKLGDADDLVGVYVVVAHAPALP